MCYKAALQTGLPLTAADAAADTQTLTRGSKLSLDIHLPAQPLLPSVELMKHITNDPHAQ